MAYNIKPISWSPLSLNLVSVRNYCEYIQSCEYNGFWWYLLPDKILGNYSRPFQNTFGDWFFWVKPGLCWPVDFFNKEQKKPHKLHSFIGYQIPIEEKYSNSFFCFRLIDDLPCYHAELLSSQRRRLIRKGIENSNIEIFSKLDEKIINECLCVWNEHHTRTGWKKSLDYSFFKKSWSELLECPGSTILYCKPKEKNQIVGWLILKIIGEIAYIDTIASSNYKGNANPNDSLIYTAIMNIKDIPQVKYVQYGLKSNINTLEKFKESIGFKVIKIPSKLHVSPLLKIII